MEGSKACPARRGSSVGSAHRAQERHSGVQYRPTGRRVVLCGRSCCIRRGVRCAVERSSEGGGVRREPARARRRLQRRQSCDALRGRQRRRRSWLSCCSWSCGRCLVFAGHDGALVSPVDAAPRRLGTAGRRARGGTQSPIGALGTRALCPAAETSCGRGCGCGSSESDDKSCG